MTPTTCTWAAQCLIDFGAGPFPGWMHRDQYGDRAIPADDLLLAKFDPYAHIASTTTLPPQPEPWFPFCIETGPFEPMPPVAPVPLPASAGLLLAAVVVLALLRRRT